MGARESTQYPASSAGMPPQRPLLCDHHAALPLVRLAAWQERRAKALIAANLNSGLSMEQLARECCLSRSHFSRAFHGSTGMSPHQWLTRQRIERARALLLGQCTLTHIAQDCGFADQAHFSRVFARMAGMPPSQWRLERLRSGSQRNGA
ncbi:helix-turn-helix domain-containing protein [Pseudomonas sp. PDM15]|uniref:helix-turn-helix domain-containing protein n=1 Tax=Pseudomonas sp. PDM15 TaxID=2769303 RepID=UPI001CE0B383|nr:AraC family transcriptional regulator [Pseudomonas sp. PDM15]